MDILLLLNVLLMFLGILYYSLIMYRSLRKYIKEGYKKEVYLDDITYDLVKSRWTTGLVIIGIILWFSPFILVGVVYVIFPVLINEIADGSNIVIYKKNSSK